MILLLEPEQYPNEQVFNEESVHIHERLVLRGNSVEVEVLPPSNGGKANRLRFNITPTDEDKLFEGRP